MPNKLFNETTFLLLILLISNYLKRKQLAKRKINATATLKKASSVGAGYLVNGLEYLEASKI